MSDLQQDLILHYLQYDDTYARKTLPFLKREYFSQEEYQVYFDTLVNFFDKYNSMPTKEAVEIELSERKLMEDMQKRVDDISVKINTTQKPADKTWLLEKTEEFCRKRAMFLAIWEAAKILEGKHKTMSEDNIPDMMQKALAVCFDNSIGLNYMQDFDRRYNYYTEKVSKIPFHLDILNIITDGGVQRKTLNAVIAGTIVGKSIFLCDLAAAYIKAGMNVLYITLEMAEEELSKRIDANLMNISIGQMASIPKTSWTTAVEKLKNIVNGNLIIKQYPTSGGHVGHFRYLLKDLKMKQNFTPDVIIVDYLNIAASAKMKVKNSLYDYVKTVAEELRGLAVETNTAMWTATQFNRTGYADSDADMTNASESFGTVMTLDFLFALIKTEELSQIGQLLGKQLKSRYGDVDKNNKFVLGLDKDKMRFYDVNNNLNGGTATWNGNTSQSPKVPTQTKTVTNNKNKFSGIKV